MTTGIRKPKPTFNMMAAPKGGIGKTTIAAQMVQAWQRAGLEEHLAAYDFDTNNNSMASIPGLHAPHIKLVDAEKELVTARCKPVFEEALGNDKTYILDAGGGAFHALTGFITSLSVADALAEQGKRLTVHTVLVGADDLDATITGFVQVMEWVPENADVVVWFNEYKGPVASGQVHFADTDLFKKHLDTGKIVKVARLPTLKPVLRDAAALLSNGKRTVAELLAGLKDDPTRRLDYNGVERLAALMFPVVDEVVFGGSEKAA